MAFYKNFISIWNRAKTTRASRVVGPRGKMLNAAHIRLQSPSRSTIAVFGLAAFLLISRAPVFAVVAPSVRAKVAVDVTPSANTTVSLEDRIAAVEQKTADAQAAGDNAWMLISSGLVLLMTGPGLALFYAGLVRKKNVLGTMMQSFALMAIITVLWGLFSYSFCFGAGNGFIGGFHNFFLQGVGSAPDADYAATIPAQTFMVYQLMFAIITPGLIAGAFAERMK